MPNLQAAVESTMSPAEIARALGVSQGRGSQIAALRKLDPEQRAAVWSGKLSSAHGYQLSRLKPATRRELFGDLLAKPKLPTRDGLKRRVDAILKGAPTAEVACIEDPNIRALSAELSALLATPVEIAHYGGGAGTLSIRYFSLDELEGVLTILRRGTASHG